MILIVCVCVCAPGGGGGGVILYIYTMYMYNVCRWSRLPFLTCMTYPYMECRCVLITCTIMNMLILLL